MDSLDTKLPQCPGGSGCTCCGGGRDCGCVVSCPVYLKWNIVYVPPRKHEPEERN